MTLLSDAVAAVRDFAQRPITTFDAFPQADPQFFADRCFATLLPLCRGVASVSDRNDVLAALAPLIADASDIFQASRIAMLCGILVEWGADPTIAISAILQRLTTQFASATPVKPEDEAALFADAPDAVKAWKGLRYMALPAMTMLCLDVNSRLAARANAGLLQGIQSMAAHQREVKFLQRLLNLCDGDELIVLHPHDNKGFRVRLEAIGTNFHLFSLLQEALVGEPAAAMLAGPRANRKVIATAKGDIPHDRLITDSAVWHFYTWAGLLSDGTLATTQVTTWILGEQTPHEIPPFEGERVLLLGPPIFATRAWDSSFFTNLHDALRSKVEVVDILSADEIALRLSRIRKAPRAAG